MKPFLFLRRKEAHLVSSMKEREVLLTRVGCSVYSTLLTVPVCLLLLSLPLTVGVECRLVSHVVRLGELPAVGLLLLVLGAGSVRKEADEV